MIRLFVGTDPRQGPADEMLLRSVERNTSVNVEVTMMRHGDGEFGGWNIGREPGKPKGGGWGTDFAAFRMAVPELCGFEGVAVYLDCDMIVLGDLRDLVALPRAKPVLCTSQKIMDVLVIDCGAFAGSGWPTIAEMRASGRTLYEYRKMLARMDMIDPSLPPEWDCRDCAPANAQLVHFTDVTTQPWQPWPEAVAYRDHPDENCCRLWDEYRSRA